MTYRSADCDESDFLIPFSVNFSLGKANWEYESMQKEELGHQHAPMFVLSVHCSLLQKSSGLSVANIRQKALLSAETVS